MRDITAKSFTKRTATASALVKVGSPDTIRAIENGTVPKGNVFEMARAAALLGVKQTPYLIPDCHPLPVEFAEVHYTIEGLTIEITVTVGTIYKTGVEVEAMHGVSVAALTIYDMLKPLDKNIEIAHIRLLEKKGGKSGIKPPKKAITAAVIVCSDSISKGKKTDVAGKVICEKLSAFGVSLQEYVIIPDEVEEIQKKTMGHAAAETDLIVICGGTGLSPRDVTPEALKPILDREIPGIMETARAYGQSRTPYSMLSRGVAGLRGKSLVLGIPGSTGGASETMDALLPHVLHIFDVLDMAYRHGQ